jgi:hypothetical protein
VGVHFYEQVPEDRWDIPLTKRIRSRLFKLKWSRAQFVDYLSSTILAKVECDILGWNNYSGFRAPTSCPSCNEFDAEVELVPVHLVFLTNLASSYSSRFDSFSELVSGAIEGVSHSMSVTIENGDDGIVKASRSAAWSRQEIDRFLTERMVAYQSIAQGRSIRVLPQESFSSLKDTLVQLHGCNRPECGRFEFVDQCSVTAYFDYLEDGFSFIKLV